MRNPERIDLILSELSILWKLHPDWRLCQLLSNAATGLDPSFYKEPDLFYMEDGDLLRGLRKLKET
jgi:hypothetical protein